MQSIMSWSLNRIIALGLLFGLIGLMSEIRWEHRVELGRQWQTWIPLVYIGLMIVIGVIGLIRWESWGRRLLLFGFAFGIIIGALGVYFHGGDNLFGNLSQVLASWGIPLGTNGGVKVSSEPPILAPLAFIGVGLLGILVCSRRFRAE